jgi:hypothetical protein
MNYDLKVFEMKRLRFTLSKYSAIFLEDLTQTTEKLRRVGGPVEFLGRVTANDKLDRIFKEAVVA